MPEIALDPDTPVTITVDLQSVHHTAFRLFTRKSQGDPLVLLKKGAADTTFTTDPAMLGAEIKYEFLFFKAKPDFRAAIVFEQESTTQVVPVQADGDASFTFDFIAIT